MSTATKAARAAIPHPADAPRRLFTFKELEAVTGVHWRVFKRRCDDGEMGFVQVGPERGRRVRGDQYLAWEAANERKPEGASR